MSRFSFRRQPAPEASPVELVLPDAKPEAGEAPEAPPKPSASFAVEPKTPAPTAPRQSDAQLDMRLKIHARLIDEIEDGLSTGLRPRIVLNRLASRMFGPAPSMTEAEKALQRKAEAGVSSDWEAAAASANLGGPIAQHRPKS